MLLEVAVTVKFESITVLVMGFESEIVIGFSPFSTKNKKDELSSIVFPSGRFVSPSVPKTVCELETE